MIIVVSQFLVFLTAPCNHYEEQTFISMRTLFWKNLHSLLLLSIFFYHNIFVFILLLFYVWYPFLSDAFVPFFYIYICFICLFCNFLFFFLSSYVHPALLFFIFLWFCLGFKAPPHHFCSFVEHFETFSYTKFLAHKLCAFWHFFSFHLFLTLSLCKYPFLEKVSQNSWDVTKLLEQQKFRDILCS